MHLRVEFENYNHNLVREPGVYKFIIYFLFMLMVDMNQKINNVSTYLLSNFVSTYSFNFECYDVFLAMCIVKNRLCNEMDNDFLTNTLLTYVKRDITKKITIESIINEFRDNKGHTIYFLYMIELDYTFYNLCTVINSRFE